MQAEGVGEEDQNPVAAAKTQANRKKRTRKKAKQAAEKAADSITAAAAASVAAAVAAGSASGAADGDGVVRWSETRWFSVEHGDFMLKYDGLCAANIGDTDRQRQEAAARASGRAILAQCDSQGRF